MALLSTFLVSCGGSDSQADSSGSGNTIDVGGRQTLRILSGSENKELTSILEAFAKKEKINIAMTYSGSLDIMRALQSDTTDYDAVWPASSMWITAGDTSHRVKHAESISITPVIFGIRRSLAESLGFVGKAVTVSDLLAAIRDKKLKFCMTSCTQSNSGCCAYIGFLYALLGNPEMITSEDLNKPELAEKIKELFSGVDRSSGSSDWLKDMFLAGDYDAMVNYECLIISANQELEKAGKETLYAVYPEDGLSLADSPLGYVDQGDSGKEEAFLKLQEYLLSDEVQNEIQKTGRRTGYTLNVSEENRSVFNTDWGIQPDRVLSPFKMPATDVLMEALNLYQTTFRKPSLTVYCLDYSGSMDGTGNEQLEEAMRQILDQNCAAENLLQASEGDVNVVILFSHEILDVWTADGSADQLSSLYEKIKAESPYGGTDIYNASIEALNQLENYDLSQYNTAVILMTDGMSRGSYNQFRRRYTSDGNGIPFFSIMFGDAESGQLEDIAQLTNARVFDGRTDLIAAFRSVKGYN